MNIKKRKLSLFSLIASLFILLIGAILKILNFHLANIFIFAGLVLCSIFVISFIIYTLTVILPKAESKD